MSETDPERFADDGVILIRGLLDPDLLDLATTGVDRVLAQPGPRRLDATADGDAGSFVEDFIRWPDIAEIDAVARHPRVAGLAARLTRSTRLVLHHDHVLVKEAGTTTPTPWHQDQPYYDADGSQTVSFWIALDLVPAEVCPLFVRGTHRGPWYLPRTFATHEARWFPPGSLVEIDSLVADLDTSTVLTADLEPGDAIAFSWATVHSAPGAGRSSRRRALSLRYAGDDVVRVQRPWRCSPDFDDDDPALEGRSAWHDPRFLRVWPPTIDDEQDANR